MAGLSHDWFRASVGRGRLRQPNPRFIMAPIGGIVADRLNRQRVVIGTQISSMILASPILAGAHALRIECRCGQIMVLRFRARRVNAFDIPARQAFLIDMVGREDLMNAIALNSSMFNGRPHHRSGRLPAYWSRPLVKVGASSPIGGHATLAVIVGLLLIAHRASGKAGDPGLAAREHH